MGKKRINMVIQIEIQRLKKLGHSKNKTAAILGVNRESVRKYWNEVDPAIAVIPIEDSLAWANHIDWPVVEKELEAGIKKTILYNELKGVSILPTYSSFCRFLTKKFPKLKKLEISIRIVRIPGDSVEVDYSGESISFLNPATGEIIDTELFVAASSYSSYFYAEFTLSQKLDDFIASHTRMFTFFGIVHKFIIPDNLKSGVTKADKYDPIINRTYHDMCTHYGIIVDPARARKPKDKPNVERAVGIIQNEFFQLVRKKTYTSLYELNKDLRDFLNKRNLEIMRGRGKSRAELFEKEKLLRPSVPTTPYELFHFKTAKLHADCHFQFDRNYYSAPYRFAGKELDIKFNDRFVYVYYQTELLKVHSRLAGHGHFCTDERHYPERKIVEMGIVLLSIQTAAKAIGPNTEAVIERLVRTERHPLKNLRKMQGILAIGKGCTAESMEFACGLALEHDRLFYRFIKSCASSYRPKVPSTTSMAPVRQLELICLQGEKS